MEDTLKACVFILLAGAVALALIIAAPSGEEVDVWKEAQEYISALRGPVTEPNPHILRKHPDAAKLPAADFKCVYANWDIGQFAYFTDDPCGPGDDKDLIGMVIYRLAYAADVGVDALIACGALFVVVTAFFAPRKRHRRMIERDGYTRWK